MGNRAVIASSKDNDSVGIYVHWNGGLESVLAFLEVARQRDYRDPIEDSSYGMARLTGVIHEFLDGGLSLGINTLNMLDVDNWDNGAYLIGADWKIIERWGKGSENKMKVSDLDELEKKQYKGIVSELIYKPKED